MIDFTNFTLHYSNQCCMGDLDFTEAKALEVGQRVLNRAVSEELRPGTAR